MMKDECNNIFDLLRELKSLRVYYEIKSYSLDSLTLVITIPSTRIEIECYKDAPFEVAIFSGEEISDISLNSLLEMLKDN